MSDNKTIGIRRCLGYARLARMAGFCFAVCLLLAACAQNSAGSSFVQPPSTQQSQDVSSTEQSSASQPLPAVVSPTQSEPPRFVVPGLDAENYPIVDGSTATMPLMAHVYSSLCDVPLAQAEAGIQVSQTYDAWRRMFLQDEDGLLLLVYEMPEDILQRYGDSLQDVEITPVGRDALVFLTGSDNPATQLSQDQLRGIYEFTYTDWGELGGTRGMPVQPVHRNQGSGSRTLFDALLYPKSGQQAAQSGDEGADMDPPIPEMPGMPTLLDYLAGEDPGAIGYSVYYYAQEMYGHSGLQILAVDGVQPTGDSIADGSYPLTNDFYVVIRADEPADSPARLLRDWLLGEEGRQILTFAGYVPAT